MTVHVNKILPENPAERDVSFPSGEYTLRGRLFMPALQPKVVVILNSATGVPARFYYAFARWLAEVKGYGCLTYDYRGFGASKSTLKGRILMSDWAVHDCQAARDYICAHFKSQKVWIIGHSLGAMALPFQRDLQRIDRCISVGGGMSNVRDHPFPYQLLARLFWFGHVPLIVAVTGYLPAWLGAGSELPGLVYWQWRRWCTKRSFFVEDIGRELPFPDWAGLTAPMKFVAIADDVMVPPKAVWRLMRCYPRAQKTQLVLAPEKYRLKQIGHLHAFSEHNKACWDDIIA